MPTQYNTTRFQRNTLVANSLVDNLNASHAIHLIDGRFCSFDFLKGIFYE